MGCQLRSVALRCELLWLSAASGWHPRDRGLSATKSLEHLPAVSSLLDSSSCSWQWILTTLIRLLFIAQSDTS